MSVWALIGLGVLVAIALMADDNGGDGGDDDKGGTTDDDKSGDQTLTVQDGMTAAQVQELLRKEGDRIDQKYKGILDKRIGEAKAEWEREQKTAADREQMSELEKAKTDLAATQAERDALTKRVAAVEARQERAEWIAANAGDLDRAWRSYLHQQLEEAGDDETPDQVLARVQKERDEEQGGTSTSLGVAGRPGGQSKPQTGKDMNRAIRRAAGRG